MTDIFRLEDEYGPQMIVHIREPAVDLRAVVVVDNTAAGAAIGGARMAPDVSVEECFRLARAMTMKNAAAGLPHGGAKSVIFADPAMPLAKKEALIRAFASAIRDLADYIPGPDMGTDEKAMAWIKDEIGRAVGLPAVIGGIPLDEIGATGFGLVTAAEVAQEFCDVKLAGARFAVQGFGAVGKHVAQYLAERGAILVAASDSRGTIANPDGLDIEALIKLKAEGRPLTDYDGGQKLGRDDIIGVACDIWIPAARPDALREDNVGRLQARLVIQGANIPATSGAEKMMADRGILSVPDFIANAGGVICAAVEYRGGSASVAFDLIREKVSANTQQVLQEARDKGLLPREAAMRIATRRVREAMALRRWR